MKEHDVKLLWGRAANRCAICRIELSQVASSKAFPLGEQAHIVAESKNGPRGNSILSLAERNSYANIILLCPTHHTIIDKDISSWPVEKLHLKKSNHELWVQNTLSESADPRLLAEQITVTHVIDSAVELCELEHWKSWTRSTLGPFPFWPVDMPSKIYEFSQIVYAAIWPARFDDLRRSMQTFSTTLHDAAETFMRHSKISRTMYVTDPFYKSGGWNPNYDEDLQTFKMWVYDCHRKIRTATKAANWFADIVRRDVNPSFFAKSGKFIIFFNDDLSEFGEMPEFSEAEKVSLPASLPPRTE